MNKKYFWSLLTFVMVAMLSVSFTACGSDDDNDNGVSSSIVGKWLRETSSLREEVHIKADKTWIVYWQEKTSKETYSGEESGTWDYDEDNGILTVVTINGEKPGTRTFDAEVDGNKLIMQERKSGSKIVTYTRM